MAYQKKLIVFALDFDDCAMWMIKNNTSNPEDYSTLKQIEIDDQNPLFQHMLRIIRENSQAEFGIYNGSSRQDLFIDLYNARRNKTISVFEALPAIANALSKKTGKDVGYLPLTTTDLVEPQYPLALKLYEGKTAIEAVEYLAEITSKENFSPESIREPKIRGQQKYIYSFEGDANKILLVYVMMQSLASANVDKKVEIHFYDDRENILNKLYQFYSENNVLLPAQVALNLYQFGYYNKNIVIFWEGVMGNASSPHNKNFFLTYNDIFNHNKMDEKGRNACGIPCIFSVQKEHLEFLQTEFSKMPATKKVCLSQLIPFNLMAREKLRHSHESRNSLNAQTNPFPYSTKPIALDIKTTRLPHTPRPPIRLFNPYGEEIEPEYFKNPV